MHRRTRAVVALLALAALLLANLVGIRPPVSSAWAEASADTPVEVHHSCQDADPDAGTATCFSLYQSAAARYGVDQSVAPRGYAPTDLQEAYSFPSDRLGEGAVVAVVSAFDNPKAEADLAVYRSQFGLPPCTTENGCFSKVDQRGGTDYPQADFGWAQVSSLSLDVVSAVCPRCHLLLVEADSAGLSDLTMSADRAAKLGASAVANQYGTQNDRGEGYKQYDYDPYFDHPGVAMVAGTGSGRFGVSYPAASNHVVAVAGTSLEADDSTARGFRETVWNNAYGGTGSGCSGYEEKPSFQTDDGCAMRTVADVAAVADPLTGVAGYDSFGFQGWAQFGGSAVAAAVVAGTYGLAGPPPTDTTANSIPYAATDGLNDITEGLNGECEPAYLCTAGPGYDGPSGLGSPRGVTAFRAGPHGTVTGTVTETASGAPISGAEVDADGPFAATTRADANGHFSLTLPAGAYTVTAADYAHRERSTSVTVTANQTGATELRLAALPATTVTGRVVDGSGHGWPLYARVTVDGLRGPAAYTDPATGRYSLTLPKLRRYTLRATPVRPGYGAATASVDVGINPATSDLTVPIDAERCVAAGYTTGVTGKAETFDAATTPDGWTVKNVTSNGWTFIDAQHRGNHTGGSGGFAIIDSGPAATPTGGYLISPETDLTGLAHPAISFDADIEGGRATIEASTDGGAHWTGIWDAAAAGSLAGPKHLQVPVPPDLATARTQVRLTYISALNADQWWAIDDVVLGDAGCTTVAGGLVTGVVRDANTGAPVNTARVSVGSESWSVTGATDDPARPNGFYELFSPAIGTQPMSVQAAGYAPHTGSVSVTVDAVSVADLTMSAARIAVSTTQVDAEVALGGSAVKRVTISNTGSAPTRVQIAEEGVDATVASAPLRRVTVRHPTQLASGAPASMNGETVAAPSVTDQGWTQRADFPMPNAYQTLSVHDPDNGRIYTVGWSFFDGIGITELWDYDPAADTWTQRVAPPVEVGMAAIGWLDGRLILIGGVHGNVKVPPPVARPVAAVQIYDPATGSWTRGPDLPDPRAGAAAATLDGQLYLIGGCEGTLGCGDGPSSADALRYDPQQNSWRRLADYPAAVNGASCAGVGGELVCAGGIDGGWENGGVASKATYVFDPSTGAWSRGADLPIDLYNAAGTAAAGQLIVASGITAQGGASTNQVFGYQPGEDAWQALPNVPYPIFNGSAVCGLFTVGVQSISATAALRTQHLAGYGDCGDGADTPWLAEDLTAVDLAPGQSTTLTIALSAEVAATPQPGSYQGRLRLTADSPYPIATIAAHLTVQPPKSWGLLTGAIVGKDCDGGIAALPGTTVQVNSWAGPHTLTTDASGRYRLWLDRRNNPLTLIVSDDGWHAQSRVVRIKAGAETSADFTLLTALGCK